MPRSWIEVRVEIPRSLAEAVSNFLIEQGSPGVVEEEPRGPSGKARETIVAYFPNDRSYPATGKRVRRFLASLEGARGRSSLKRRILREEKWAEAWKENFRTFHATPRLVIKPPWEAYAGKKGETVIEIDPGMAFGTGSHPSTRMCLGALEELIPALGRPSVLDVGTGSGILAIAARKMGAGKIVAVDIDPVAVECARKNAAANRSAGIDFRVGSPAGLRGRFQVVVANLLPQELLSLAPPLARRLRPGGVLVLSGILRGQKREIGEAFAKEGLVLRKSREMKGWVGLQLIPAALPLPVEEAASKGKGRPEERAEDRA